MKTTDFRIGNYLQDREGRICRVEEIRDGEVKAYAIKGGLTSLPIRPIKITEEILIKAGFKKENLLNPDEFTHYSGVQFFLSEGRLKINYFDEFTAPREYKYVHQLQNLFHAITGEELELEL